MSQSVSASAKGVTFLVFVQLTSRALTFGANQILLRHFSPALFGASAQLDLFLLTALFFSRESIRIALQRQSHDVQGILNTSFLAIFLGLLLTPILVLVYLVYSPFDFAFARVSQSLYGVAAVIELCSEPCFTLVQYKLAYSVRAQAETLANIARCLVLLALTIWFRQSAIDGGLLPFAMGQIAYAMTLCLVYYWRSISIAKRDGVMLSLTPIRSKDPTQYIISYFPRPICNLAVFVYLQNAAKYLLTQGDAIVVSSMAELSEQGAYALAANYGSLAARIVFQPVEESSRILFAKLCTRIDEKHDISERNKAQANAIIIAELRLYNLLALVMWSLAPHIAPTILHALAGDRWINAGAGDVLAAYCYYVPLMALNGVSEAFVAAVATKQDLRRQTWSMTLYTAAFACAAFMFLRVFRSGAKGIVWANCLNMGFRIVFNGDFISKFFKRHKMDFDMKNALPRVSSISVALAGAAIIRGATPTLELQKSGTMQALVSGGLGAIMLSGTLFILERKFLWQCYSMVLGQGGSDAIK